MKLKISVRYSSPEPGVLEIGFYRGETLLHNIFYNIEGFDEDELLELKKEAVAMFSSCFPDVPSKEILKGFDGVDPLMYDLYKKTFNPKGAGNKKGSKRTNEPASRRTIRLSDKHYAIFKKKGGTKRLRELIDNGLFWFYCACLIDKL